MYLMSKLFFDFKNYFFLYSPLDQFEDDEDENGEGEDNFFDDILDLFDIEIKMDNDSFDLLNLVVFDIIDENFDTMIYEEIPLFLVLYHITSYFEDEDAGEETSEDDDSEASLKFSYIFSSNLWGMIPWNDTETAEAAIAFFISFGSIMTVSFIGWSLHSNKVFALWYPAGTPTILAPFIIIIEMISYLSRLISLGMRLFANMFAGHCLLKILMSFSWVFLHSIMPLTSIPVMLMLIIILCMELIIAYLQSYVFTVLFCMYNEEILIS